MALKIEDEMYGLKYFNIISTSQQKIIFPFLDCLYFDGSCIIMCILGFW